MLPLAIRSQVPPIGWSLLTPVGAAATRVGRREPILQLAWRLLLWRVGVGVGGWRYRVQILPKVLTQLLLEGVWHLRRRCKEGIRR